ncbi:MAG: hypothetical protein NTV86_13710 [Planctomycetota bacterium]|nr:hypothetical protein [Planctomycetota bacterium]
MKKSHVLVGVGLGLLLATSVFAQRGPTSAASSRASSLEQKADHEALRALVPLYEQAANEGKPSLLKPHLDPEFTGVMVTGDEVTGFSSLEDYWRKIRALIGADGKYTVKVNVAAPATIDGGLALARGTTSERVVTEKAARRMSTPDTGPPSAGRPMASGGCCASRHRWTPYRTPLSQPWGEPRRYCGAPSRVPPAWLSAGSSAACWLAGARLPARNALKRAAA